MSVRLDNCEFLYVCRKYRWNAIRSDGHIVCIGIDLVIDADDDDEFDADDEQDAELFDPLDDSDDVDSDEERPWLGIGDDEQAAVRK